MFVMESRLPSQWLGRAMGSAAQALEEGNSLDRVVLFGLIVLSIGVLAARSFRWGSFLGNNLLLTMLVLYGLFSVLWSDFPIIALKRWIRDLGNYLVILIVLYETNPLEAVRAFLRRLYYVLIPLSILLIKYFPASAISYGFWSGLAEFVGAATSKNTLGAMCMLSGVFFFWDTLTRWPQRKEKQTKRILLVNVLFILMSYWVLRMSSSATAFVCFLLGCSIILVYSAWGKRHVAFFKFAIPTFFVAYIILGFGFGLNDALAAKLGRDATLTGRTNIWDAVLSTDVNPLLGTGYESFWLGPRLMQVWQKAGAVNQAHNGYLEFYLNFGIIGLLLLAGLLIASYRAICKRFTDSPGFASLAVALWTIPLFYNLTEAAFKPSFMCLTFLLGAMVIPQRQLQAGLQRRVYSRGLPPSDRGRLTPKFVRNKSIATAEKPQGSL
jgi:O-antigen ligase